MSLDSKEDLSRYDKKLEHILRTAARIFAEKSYHSTSMRDISRATGVSLAGLYHYCKSKEELLFLIQDHCFGRVLERLDHRIELLAKTTAELRSNLIVPIARLLNVLFGASPDPNREPHRFGKRSSRT